jgi:hypothetical protein
MAGVLSGAALSRISSATAHERHFGFWRRDDDDHHHGHHDHHDAPSCFLEGTRILTPQGERKIEDLRRGDRVVTFGGQAAPVEWVGTCRYRRAPKQEWESAVMPVRIARGALAPDVPRADLFLSQEHCLLLDGGLIRVGDLVNGMTIALAPCHERSELEYLHVKLANHTAIYAEGAAAETLLLNAISAVKIDALVDDERLRGVSLDEQPCAPVYSDVVFGGRRRVLSHVRSAISPWVDRRGPFERIRDRLWDRAEDLAA